MSFVYQTAGGVTVTRTMTDAPDPSCVEELAALVDEYRGVLLTSSFEYPDRYTRWDLGFVNPPLEIVARGLSLVITPLNDRGRRLIGPLARFLATEATSCETQLADDVLRMEIDAGSDLEDEEHRTRRPSVFTALRTIISFFAHDDEPHLGLYGAFGYDLISQLEDIERKIDRPAAQRDLVLFIPDRVLVVDHQKQTSHYVSYDFAVGTSDTAGLPRTGERTPFREAAGIVQERSHHKDEYADCVREAIEYFKRGDLFEVVPTQTFSKPCSSVPSSVFFRLRTANPAPYGALMNLGQGEYLISASPEMFVRVTDKRVETCPISGTVARGSNALEDATRIQQLLNSTKDAAELTMCTDVDRNDKSRICVPGSVKVIGRRQIEMYSRLIHTVDHVEGLLRDEFDGLDAFLSHAWAVTVTGAPKKAAIQFIENHEKSPRLWYGGAIGKLGFDGSVNTGLTLRTARIVDGIAEIRVGATLLYDSDPDMEEEETVLKAQALLSALADQSSPIARESEPSLRDVADYRILTVDHHDSFVHTLSSYCRELGADVITLRPERARSYLAENHVDLAVLSPGPGEPKDFQLEQTLRMLCDRGVPVLGVCLGLQGIVEFFGGALDVLPEPVHGKPSTITVRRPGKLFGDVPTSFQAGRYHSLYAKSLPSCLQVTATSEDGIVMALEHVDLPIAAVQFHPESLLTSTGDIGKRILRNALLRLRERIASRTPDAREASLADGEASSSGR